MGDQSPLLLENMISSQLHLDSQARRASSNTDLSQIERTEQTPVVLSTRSKAAQKLGSRQIIPKNLAVTSRPKNRHHTTVVTLPVKLELQNSPQRFSHTPDLSWEDYDSDGTDGSSMRRNRRNRSYRAAVTSLDSETAWKQDLQPLSEEKGPSPKPTSSPGRKVSPS